MEITELRIGNYVKDENEIYQIESEHFDMFDTLQTWEIPITKEWMIDFGFKKEKLSSYGGQDMWAGLEAWSFDGECLFRGSPNCLHLVGYFNTQIKYIHQLQNLFYFIKNKELILKKHE